MPMTRFILVTALVAVGAMGAAAQDPGRTADGPVYVAYYWRAKPDKIAEYNAYIREYAEPIDEAARQAGAFEEVRTYLAPARTDGQQPEWTHLRVFRVKNAAAADALSAALDAATKKLRTPEQQKAASARSAGLRDFVRSERWTELR
jgi:hypothetical protein